MTMTKSELLETAKGLGYEINDKATKREIIEMIQGG